MAHSKLTDESREPEARNGGLDHPDSTPPAEAVTPRYTMGYDEEFQQLLRRRSAETHAARLLSQIRPGTRILDFGCGPGTISVGLAKAVAPGELHGIDMEESQIEMARAAAAAGGHSNAFFQVGDVTDPSVRRLRVRRRSLQRRPHARPRHPCGSGRSGPRAQTRGHGVHPESIISASFFEPDLGSLNGAVVTFARLLEANGGHPEMGKRIKHELVKAGFCDPVSSAEFEVFDSPADREFYHGFVEEWFFAEKIIDIAKKLGIAGEEDFKSWRTSLGQWKTHPGAYATLAWGCTLANKPG